MATYDYPRWKHHKTLASRLVKDPDEEAALGPDWSDRVQQPMHPGPVVRCPHCAQIEEHLFEIQQRMEALNAEVTAERGRLQAENFTLKQSLAQLQDEAEAAKAKPDKKRTRVA